MFATIAPACIMTALFAATGAVAATGTRDPLLFLLYVAGLVASAIRLAVTIRMRARMAAQAVDGAVARTIERRFGAAYVGFAIVLGLFAARAIAILPDAMDMLVAVLLVGYAAGASAGTAFRPAIAMPGMFAAVIPAIVSALIGGDAAHAMLGLLLGALLAGGARSTMVRYHAAVREFEMRHLFATLARTDPLTGLPNRLALTEHLVAAQPGVVVHCIDLDDFKPINDTYGHQVGDSVLRATAGRLMRLIEPDDLVARLGGDEFVVVRAAGHPADADGFSLRVALALSEPFGIAGAEVSVGASAGWALLAAGDDADTVVARADQALYRAKANRAGDRNGQPVRPAIVAERLPPRHRRRSRLVGIVRS